MLNHVNGLYGSGLTLILYQQASHGTVQLNTDGTFVYSQNSNYTGGDSFAWALQYADGECTGSATVTIPAPQNVPLSIPGGEITIQTDTAGNVIAPNNTLAGVTDPLGVGAYVASFATPSAPYSNAISIDPDGTLHIIDIPSRGDVTFQETICRKNGGSSPIVIGSYLPQLDCGQRAVNVEFNSYVHEQDDSYFTTENTPLVITDPAKGVAANDYGTNSRISDGGFYGYGTFPGTCTHAQNPGCPWLMGVTVTTPPLSGVVVMNNDGTFTYTPKAGFTGTDSFTYTDQSNSPGATGIQPATVDISVNPPPDTTPPTLTLNPTVSPSGGTSSAPVYVSQDVGVGQPLRVNVNTSDADPGDIARFACTDNGTSLAFSSELIGNYSLALAPSPNGYSSAVLELGEGTHAISCTSLDGHGNTVTQSATYSVDSSPPTLSLSSSVSPSGGSSGQWFNGSDLGGVFHPGNGHTLTVTATATAGASSFAITGITCTDQLGSARSATGATLIWPPLGDGETDLQCAATDSAGAQSAPVSGQYIIDTYAPSQNFSLLPGAAATGGPPLAPWYNASDTGGAGQPLRVLVSACDNCGVIDPAGLYVYSENVSGLALQSCTVDSGTPVTSTQSPMELDLGDGIHTVTCTSVDNAGNASPPITRTFDIDTTLPNVTLVKDGPSTGSPVVVTFSEPVAAESLASFQLSPAGGQPMPITPSCAVTVVAGRCASWRLAHSTPLVPGMGYYLSLGPTGAPLTDVYGNALAPYNATLRGPTKLASTDPAIQQRWSSVADPGSFGGSYARDDMPGSTYSYTFTGTSVTWYTHRGPDQAIAQVDVTNPSGTAVHTTVDNYAPSPQDQVPVTYSGLTNRTHIITITSNYQTDPVSSGYDVAVEGFSANGGPVVTPPGAGTAHWAVFGSGAGAFIYNVEAGASFTFGFYGTSAALTLREGPIMGIADVTVDGKPKPPVDTYAPSYGWSAPVTVAKKLVPSFHTVTITIDQSANPASAGNQIGLSKVSVG